MGPGWGGAYPRRGVLLARPLVPAPVLRVEAPVQGVQRRRCSQLLGGALRTPPVLPVSVP